MVGAASGLEAGKIAAATGNTVNIAGGTFSDVIGGQASSYDGLANAGNNTVNFTGGTASNIYGGATGIGGPASAAASTATGNRVFISGGTVNGYVYGGYSSIGAGIGSATGNTVTISGAPTMTAATLYGGWVDNGSGNPSNGDAFTGNTLNWNTSGLTVAGVENFEFINFNLPSGITNGATMLNVTTAVNLDNTTMGMSFNGAAPALLVGNMITLISSVTNTPTNNNTTATVSGYTFQISVSGSALIATVTAVPGGGGGGGGGGDDPYVPPSGGTTPTEISVTLSGAKIKAEKQTDGTWLIVLPAGSNVTALQLSFTLPAGATISPSNNSAQDFSNGSVTYTITAQDGTTKAKIVVVVKVESVAPTERQYFSTTPGLCEVGYVTNEDGSVAVDLRIPLTNGADPAKIEAIRATLTGFAPLGALSYAYADFGGNLIPITTKSARSASVPAPYLQITFRAANLDAAKAGGLGKIAYWLKGDAAEYTQTYTTPLALSEMILTDETPRPEPEEPDDETPKPEPEEPEESDDEPGDLGQRSSGGCDTGTSIFALCLLPLAGVESKKKIILPKK
jgi:hypothetical protein